MPKDEFDFEDPFELNGMALLTTEDSTAAMAECFIEEFMRMGYGHKQILALFRDPHYLGPNLALQKQGEPFIRQLITDAFARWGKSIAWPNQTETLNAAHPGAPAPQPLEPLPSPANSGLATDPPRPSSQELAGLNPQPLCDPLGAPVPEFKV